MKTNLPPSVAKKLRAIRRRAIAFKLFEGLLLSAAALLGAMLIAMTIDWLVGWFDPRARYVMTTLALGAAATAFALWCVRPLLHRHTIAATAREVDETLPQLEERWSTVTELAQSNDAPEVRGSEAMIHKVADEAEAAGTSISPEVVVSAKPVFRASRWLIGAAAVLAVLFAVNFTQTKLLAQRFLMPGKSISLTQVSASPADVWVPKGESLTVNAAVKGRVPADGAKLFIRPENGAAREVAMTPKTAGAGEFQHALQEVSGSFEYRVRSGDGQTPWHRITAVDRPNISAVKLSVTPPAYSKLPKEEKNSLPNAVRVLEGSDVQVSFKSDQPLDKMLIDFGDGKAAQLTADKDDWYHFRARPTNSFTFAAAAINKFKLENKTKPSCRISVYEDLAPSVKVLEPSDDVAVLPGEKVDVVFQAQDDFGIAKAEVIVSTTKADGETNTVTIPVDLAADEGKKEFRKSVQLDPKALGLKHGDQLSYVVQVTDTKQTPASASAEATGQSRQASSEQQLADAKEASEQKETKETKSGEEQPQLAGKENSDAEAKDSQNSKQSEQQQNQNTARGSKNESSLAAKPKEGKSQQQQQNNGSQPPPNDMAKRMLDVGQTSECKPRNIQVDEYAGSFEGEKRKKLEIAIEPVLAQLRELLAKAQEKTDSLEQPAASAQGLQQAHAMPLSGAKAHLGESQKAIGDLKSRTSSTPYAFIGLQLHNIDAAHIAPAQKSLGVVAIPAVSASNSVAAIDKASFHIARAREMLADLTKTYETVKRDQQIADAMQKLDKMYQIFLEDTQALLGSSKGPINSYDRKIAEVDDAYVEKLKELLEEKKKIMAELANVLAEDPRLLRRYMAMMELQATSYRDQMTLLAARQKQMKEQVAKWNATPEAERAALLQELQQSYAAQHKEVIQAAAKLRENMETWLPLDVKTDEPQVQASLARAEKIVQHVSESAGGTNAGHQALAELHTLRETLPQLRDVQSTNKAKMAAYIANRLPEVEALITAQSGHMKIQESLAAGDFPKVAEVVQHRLTSDTVTLGEKLDATEKQVSRMSEEIAAKAALLNKIVQGHIIWPQKSSVDQLAVREMKPAEELINGIPPAFALAENTFDELMKLIIAKLDEAPPPDSPGGTPPGLENLLAMLEDEMKAAESLGIPCRPLNVSVMRDWMRPSQGQGQGMGMGQAQAQAAQGQAQQGQQEAQRLEKQARESAKQALAQAKKNMPADPTVSTADAKARGEAWNKLASRLQKDLLQGRDNTPPEQYRAAIENYFKVISDSAAGAEK